MIVLSCLDLASFARPVQGHLPYPLVGETEMVWMWVVLLLWLVHSIYIHVARTQLSIRYVYFRAAPRMHSSHHGCIFET